MRGKCSFTKNEVKRAVRSLLEEGLPIRGVTIEADGRFTVLAGEPEPTAADENGNPWDGVLNDADPERAA